MSEPNPPKTGGLWARLFGVQPETEETLAQKPAQEELAPGKPAPVALPDTPAEAPASNGMAAPAVVEEVAKPPVEFSPPVLETLIVKSPPQVCLACGTPRQDGLAFCQDCGWMFPVGGVGASSAGSASLVRDSTMPANSSGQL